MSLEHQHGGPSERLRALPAQLMATEGGVILVRGVAEMRITGERAIEVLPLILAAASGEGATRHDLLEQFAAPERDEIGKLIEELVKRSILACAEDEPGPRGVETSLDIFYWHFGQTARTAVGKLNEKSFVVMGVNTISRRIAIALHSLGVDGVQVVDFHALRNLRLYDEEGVLLPEEWEGPPPVVYDEWAEGIGGQDVACLVATSDFGGPQLMREWNAFCVENGVHFLPVVLDRFIGTIGPLVIPGETPCYECLRVRENANMDAPELERLAESGAAERQAVTGFHPAMTNVLGELAAMELCKSYGGGFPWHPGRIIEVNLLGPEIFSRRVLKLPRCAICSPVLKTSSHYTDKESFVPGHQLNYHEFR